MIFVTGATGFLGHHLIPRLVSAGHSLRVLVRPGSDTSFLRDYDVECFPATDINDEVIHEGVQGCRAVVHAAGHFRMWGNLLTFWRTNVGGTANVLEAARKAGVERFIHISSVAVVGETIPGRVIDEEHPCRPLDFYQRTKLEAEYLALAYQRNLGLPVTVLRPGALYGPWGRYAFNRNFFEDPLRGLRIRVARGRRITFPAFAPDVAQAIELALVHTRPGRIYNVSGESLSHNQVNHIVSDLAGISRWRLDIPAAPMILLAGAWTRLSRFTRREPFYPLNLAHYVFQDWCVSSAKATAELGFQATPFVEGARQTLEWYRQHGGRPQPEVTS